jgi:hypothetical protein
MIQNIEETQRQEDIMVVGKLLISLLRHSLTAFDRYEVDGAAHFNGQQVVDGDQEPSLLSLIKLC